MLKPAQVASRIVDEVATETGVSRNDILSDSRVRHIARARQLVCARLVFAGMPTKEVAHQMGLSQWTVSHSVKAALERAA